MSHRTTPRSSASKFQLASPGRKHHARFALTAVLFVVQGAHAQALSPVTAPPPANASALPGSTAAMQAPASPARATEPGRVAPPADAARASAPAARQSSVTEFDRGDRGDGTRLPSLGRQASLSRVSTRGSLRKIDMFHGEARVIPIAGKVKRIAIGNGGVLSATAVEDGILVLGETGGSSTLMIWSEGRVDEYLITVSEQDIAQTTRFLESLMREYPSASIERIGERFVLRGSLYKSNLDQVTELVRSLPNVVNLLREQEGFPSKKTINFKVQIVELNKNIAENLGIAWDQSISGPRADFQRVGRATGIYNQLPAPQSPDQIFQTPRTPVSIGDVRGGFFLGIATSILSTINLAVNNGDATVLAAPEVSTVSGGEARFLAGGEVPIVTSSFGGTTVEYKQYGIILNLKPLVDADNNISATIETEVSQIDASVTYGGFPAFLTRKSRSDVSMHPLETLAISGLVNSNWARAATKVPFLGDVPVLGRLFRSDNFQNRRSDLVIFVTPEVVTAQSDTSRALVQKARDIGNRVPAVETDPRYTPQAPTSTDVSPLPAPDSPPPPSAPLLPATPPASGPGAPLTSPFSTAP